MIVNLNVWFVSYRNTPVLVIFLVYTVLSLLFILFIPIFWVPPRSLLCLDIVIMLRLLMTTLAVRGFIC